MHSFLAGTGFSTIDIISLKHLSSSEDQQNTWWNLENAKSDVQGQFPHNWRIKSGTILITSSKLM